MYSTTDIKNLCNGTFSSFIEDVTITNYSYDSRSLKNGKNTLFIALKGDNRNGHDYVNQVIAAGVKTILVDQDFNTDKANIIKVENTLSALQLLAKKHRSKFNIPVIGITGSHGKTIVKEWLYQLLKDDYTICRTPKSYNSQLGVPLSILQLKEHDTLGIFEAGISKPNEMENLSAIINPTIGLFTGIGSAHQINFNSLDEKEAEKKKLFNNSEVTITNKTPNYSFEIPFTDKASIENCYCCINTMIHLGYTNEEIQKRIHNLSPIALRMEMKEGKNDCIILNDSYNVSLASLEISLEHLNEQAGNKKKCIILSDIPNYNYSSGLLEKLLEEQKVDVVVSIGSNELKNTSFNYTHFANKLEAIHYLDTNPLYQYAILIKGAREFTLESITKELEEKKNQTILTINLTKLERNLKHYKKKLNPSTKLMVMVKAFSYGTGSVEIPKALQQHGVDYLGVAYADEGIKLRKSGITTPIMVMNPEPNAFADIIHYTLEPEIYSYDLLDDFIGSLILLQKKDYPIHLKIDTGMNRLGFKEHDIPALVDLIKTQPEVHVTSIFSHLSSADSELENEFTNNQIHLFEEISFRIETDLGYQIDKHILNTAGIEKFPNAQFDMVRLGIGLYGINAAKNEEEIQPIGQLTSSIIQIKEIKKGNSVGYSRSFVASNNMTIGIIPVGYADGIKRSLGNGTFAFYHNNIPCTILGNVCMDLTMIDLSNTTAKVGDEIEIFGSNNTIELMAKKMDTIPYEVLTSISQRVKRIFIRQ